MAKYGRDKRNGCVFFSGSMYPHDEPVIVIPEGDWRRLVELVRDIKPTGCCDASECMEIDAIIKKVEAANG